MKHLLKLGAVLLLAAGAGTAATAQSAKKPATGTASRAAKADYRFTDETFNQLNSLDEQERKKYEGKIIEIKGVIKSARKSRPSSSPNRYFFYLCTDAGQEDESCAICYTNQDPTGSIGKTVTVRGKFDDAGVVALINCVY